MCEQTEAMISTMLLFPRTYESWLRSWEAGNQQKFKEKEGIRDKEKKKTTKKSPPKKTAWIMAKIPISLTSIQERIL